MGDITSNAEWQSFYGLPFFDKVIGVTTDFRGSTKSMINEIIEPRQTITKLQSGRMNIEQLDSLKVTDKTTVENYVKAEFKSYNSVDQNIKGNAVSPELL